MRRMGLGSEEDIIEQHQLITMANQKRTSAMLLLVELLLQTTLSIQR